VCGHVYRDKNDDEANRFDQYEEQAERVCRSAITKAEDETHRDTLQTALAAAEKGFRLHSVSSGTKTPAVKWKRYQTNRRPEADYREWFAGTRANIALITTGARGLRLRPIRRRRNSFWSAAARRRIRYGRHAAPASGLSRPQGRHRRQPGEDQRNGNRHSRRERLGNASRHRATEHGEYRWLGLALLPITELPVAKIGWTRERTRRVVKSLVIDESDTTVRRAPERT